MANSISCVGRQMSVSSGWSRRERGQLLRSIAGALVCS